MVCDFRVVSKFKDTANNCTRFSKFGSHKKLDVVQMPELTKLKKTCCAAPLSIVLKLHLVLPLKLVEDALFKGRTGHIRSTNTFLEVV